MCRYTLGAGRSLRRRLAVTSAMRCHQTSTPSTTHSGAPFGRIPKGPRLRAYGATERQATLNSSKQPSSRFPSRGCGPPGSSAK
eukprot:1728523-Alexandrium_andersonii.AAC.1